MAKNQENIGYMDLVTTNVISAIELERLYKITLYKIMQNLKLIKNKEEFIDTNKTKTFAKNFLNQIISNCKIPSSSLIDKYLLFKQGHNLNKIIFFLVLKKFTKVKIATLNRFDFNLDDGSGYLSNFNLNEYKIENMALIFKIASKDQNLHNPFLLSSSLSLFSSSSIVLTKDMKSLLVNKTIKLLVNKIIEKLGYFDKDKFELKFGLNRNIIKFELNQNIIKFIDEKEYLKKFTFFQKITECLPSDKLMNFNLTAELKNIESSNKFISMNANRYKELICTILELKIKDLILNDINNYFNEILLKISQIQNSFIGYNYKENISIDYDLEKDINIDLFIILEKYTFLYNFKYNKYLYLEDIKSSIEDFFKKNLNMTYSKIALEIFSKPATLILSEFNIDSIESKQLDKFISKNIDDYMSGTSFDNKKLLTDKISQIVSKLNNKEKQESINTLEYIKKYQPKQEKQINEIIKIIDPNFSKKNAITIIDNNTFEIMGFDLELMGYNLNNKTKKYDNLFREFDPQKHMKSIIITKEDTESDNILLKELEKDFELSPSVINPGLNIPVIDPGLNIPVIDCEGKINKDPYDEELYT